MAGSSDRPRLTLEGLGAHAALLAKYVDEFDSAEKRIKLTEFYTREFQHAAINELRYSARHVIQAVSPEKAPPEKEPEELAEHGDIALVSKEAPAAKELRRAIDHCLRARYDAIEIEVLYYLEAIDKFLDDYRLVPKDGVLDATYVAATKRAKAASQFGDEPIGVGDERPKQLKQLDEHCTELRDALANCEACRNSLNNRILLLREEERRHEKAQEEARQSLAQTKADKIEAAASSTRRYRITTIVAILAALAACAKVAVDWEPAQGASGSSPRTSEPPPQLPPGPPQ